MEKEIFYNGQKTKYTITDEGKIYNNSRKEIKGSLTQHGYLRVTLSFQGKKFGGYIHRFMAICFLNLDPTSKMVVNHINGNKTDNCLDNLEIITSSENLKHAYNNELKKSNTNKKCNIYTGDLENECWASIEGYEQDYEVSNLGRIKSLKYKTPIILRQDIRCGYFSVVLSKNGKLSHYTVHDLVFFTFSKLVKDKTKVIDHIDGNKLNNSYSNLRYVTKQDNLIAASREQNLRKDKKKISMYKNDVFIKTFNSIAEASDELDIDFSDISKVCRGIRKSSHGYVFTYCAV